MTTSQTALLLALALLSILWVCAFVHESNRLYVEMKKLKIEADRAENRDELLEILVRLYTLHKSCFWNGYHSAHSKKIEEYIGMRCRNYQSR